MVNVKKFEQSTTRKQEKLQAYHKENNYDKKIVELIN